MASNLWKRLAHGLTGVGLTVLALGGTGCDEAIQTFGADSLSFVQGAGRSSDNGARARLKWDPAPISASTPYWKMSEFKQ